MIILRQIEPVFFKNSPVWGIYTKRDDQCSTIQFRVSGIFGAYILYNVLVFVILDNHLTHNNNFSKLKGYGNKINFVLFERTFKVIYEDPLQLFRTLLGFRNILTKNSVQSAILVL